jgi:ABC-2 type transport system permease protein
MSAAAANISTRVPRRALRKLTVLELKLAWREPVGLILGVAVPIMLLLIFGLSSSFEKRVVAGSPITWRTELAPVLIALALVLIALISLPIPIVTQRENRFLRRLSTTPVAPSWLLAAQVAVNLVLALLAIVLIVVGDAVFFGVHAPSQVPGFILSTLLATTALFSLGLVVAAVARSARAAGAMGAVLLYPLLYFAGLWQPRQKMSPLLHHISDLTPLGAAVHAMLNSMQGALPTLGSLAVMVVWTAIAAFAAVRLFKWE